MESFFEKLFYSARWILAPFFLGLSLALLALALKFFQEVWHVLRTSSSSRSPTSSSRFFRWATWAWWAA